MDGTCFSWAWSARSKLEAKSVNHIHTFTSSPPSKWINRVWIVQSFGTQMCKMHKKNVSKKSQIRSWLFYSFSYIWVLYISVAWQMWDCSFEFHLFKKKVTVFPVWSWSCGQVTNGQARSSFYVLNSLHMITCNRITGLVRGLRVCHSLLDMFAKSPSWTPDLLGSQATSFPALPPPRHAVPFSCILPFMCPTTQAVASLIVGSKRLCFFVNDLFFGGVL